LKVGNELELWHLILTFAFDAGVGFKAVALPRPPLEKQPYLSERKFCILAQNDYFTANGAEVA
jgi:hypothetical protein